MSSTPGMSDGCRHTGAMVALQQALKTLDKAVHQRALEALQSWSAQHARASSAAVAAGAGAAAAPSRSAAGGGEPAQYQERKAEGAVGVCQVGREPKTPPAASRA